MEPPTLTPILKPLTPIPTTHLPYPLKMTIPIDWKAEEERWRNGINIQTATDKDLIDFILYKL